MKKWKLRVSAPKLPYRYPFVRSWKSIPPSIRMVLLMSMFAILSIIIFNWFGQDIEKLLTPTPILIFLLGLAFYNAINTNKRK